MQRFILLPFVFFFSFCGAAKAQQSYFGPKHEASIPLDEKVLQKLTSGYWRVFIDEMSVKGHVKSSPRNVSVCYYPDGTLLYNGNKGTWSIIDDTFIDHTLDEAAKSRLNFGGSFSITALTDTSLALTKVLTTSHDMQRTLHLKPSTMLTEREQPSSGFPYFFSGILKEAMIDSLHHMDNNTLFNMGISVREQGDYRLINIIASDTLYMIRSGSTDYQYDRTPLN